MVPENNYLLISGFGPNRLDLSNAILRACTQCGCNVLNAKMQVLGSDLTLILMVAGNWKAIAKMETTLPTLEQALGLTLISRRTTEDKLHETTMAYTIQITAIDKIGILNGLTTFLLGLGIPLEEVIGNTYTNNTGTRMISLQLKINIPATLHLATFREKFTSYSDDHNLDALLEPLRNP